MFGILRNENLSQRLAFPPQIFVDRMAQTGSCWRVFSCDIPMPVSSPDGRTGPGTDRDERFPLGSGL